MLACLMFIPQWIYSFVFMYFFWITVTQVYAGYIAKEDNSFNAMLPVSKSDIVKSKIVAILIVEGIHLATGIIFGVIHNEIYGTFNWFTDLNLAFFAMMFLMYAVFNIVFLPQYFKTAYFFGRPVIYGVIVTLIYAFLLEFGNFQYQFMRDIFEGTVQTQLIVVGVAAVLTIILTVITVKQSIRNFESIN